MHSLFDACLMAQGSENDPFFGNVNFLAHLDTDFSDVKGHSITANTAVIDTGTKKFGAGSGNTSSNRQCSYTSADFPSGTGDFTLECWAYPNSVAGQMVPVGIGTGTNNNDGSQYNGLIAPILFGSALYCLTVGGALVGPSSNTATASAWHHIAVSRTGGKYYLALDGTVTQVTRAADNATGTVLVIGHHVGSLNTSYRWNGFVDEVRYTKGVARYTANFTPPAAPFPDA